MDVNGCRIVCSLNADSPDGFEAIVSRYVGVRWLQDGIPEKAEKVTRGPFITTETAVRYAMSWSDAKTPPPMPVPIEPPKENADDSKEEKKTETDSTSQDAATELTGAGKPYSFDASEIAIDNKIESTSETK